MIANHEEALRSLDIAKQALSQGNAQKALKFTKKSLSLHHTDEAESFLTSLDSANTDPPPPPQSTTTTTTNSTSSSSKQSSESLRNRKQSNPKISDYTPEQLREVNRIRKIKDTDFYAVLGLNKDADESDVKKAYRKLALVLHPDKNSAPGADEAFKIVSKAFSILSDPDKRSQYDRYGNDPDSRQSASRASNPFQGGNHPFTNHPGFMFEGEIDPEVIFATFFGPGFQFQRGPQPQPARRRQQQQGNRQPYSFLQFMPLLLIVTFSFINWLFSGPNMPEYSFNRTRQLNKQLTSPTYNVPIYVHQPTWHKFKSSRHVRGFWDGVEAQYINTLADHCKREQTIRENAIRKAQGWGLMQVDQDELKEAKSIPMPSCAELRRHGFKVRNMT